MGTMSALYIQSMLGLRSAYAPVNQAQITHAVHSCCRISPLWAFELCHWFAPMECFWRGDELVGVARTWCVVVQFVYRKAALRRACVRRRMLGASTLISAILHQISNVGSALQPPFATENRALHTDLQMQCFWCGACWNVLADALGLFVVDWFAANP